MKMVSGFTIAERIFSDDEKGTMDNLIEALKTGEAFAGRAGRTPGKRTPRQISDRRALQRTKSRQNMEPDDVTPKVSNSTPPVFLDSSERDLQTPSGPVMPSHRYEDRIQASEFFFQPLTFAVELRQTMSLMDSMERVCRCTGFGEKKIESH